MTESVHGEYEEISKRIWAGQYFGTDGAIMLSSFAYRAYRSKDYEKRRLVALMFMSTLYSAINHCVAQVKRLRLGYLFTGVKLLWQLNDVLSGFLYDEGVHRTVFKDSYKELEASQKEVLMAILLLCRFAFPFSGYRKTAIKIGEDILSEDMAEHATFLLVIARLSRLWFYSKAKWYRKIVLNNIYDLKQQENLGWKTINRLARLIGDKKMVAKSAPLADSKDVEIKSGR